jgi:hypothetical protein
MGFSRRDAVLVAAGLAPVALRPTGNRTERAGSAEVEFRNRELVPETSR